MPRLVDLRCEFAERPLGLTEPRPRLGWRLDGAKRQEAYRVTVGSRPGASDLWDTGRRPGDGKPYVEYDGAELPERARAYWRVEGSVDGGVEVGSDDTYWETGLRAWRARWIQGPLAGGPSTGSPAPYFRRAFELGRPAEARLSITALGLYEAFLNGERVGDHRLAPGWTDVRKRLRFQTYDVGALVRPGENELLVVLGDGWYCGHVGWRERQFYGDRPKLLAQLDVLDASGASTCVRTDESWRTGVGPILEADLLMGESFDARAPVRCDWPAEVVEPDVGLLEGVAAPPIRELRRVASVAVSELAAWPAPRWLVDFGQNLVGHVELKAELPPGAHLTFRHGEALDAEGRLYTANLRSARCVDHYTASGGLARWAPRFTFHGFRYVEVSGLPEAPGPETLAAVVLASDLPQIGSFECSEPLLNQLQRNILWGWRGNSLDVPTDCPQRDERLGWTGDAQVFCRTACLNTFAAGFFEKFQQDLADAQGADGRIPAVAPDVGVGVSEGGPAWADAFAICPWRVYEAYGDRRILERFVGPIGRWVRQQAATSRDGLRCFPEFDGFQGFGDWLSIEAETPKPLLGAAFFAYSAGLLARIAGTLGLEAEERWAGEVAGTATEAFRRELRATGAGTTQTALVLALHFRLVPEGERAELAERLAADVASRSDHISTGFVGATYVLHALAEAGRIDLAYRLLEQRTWPSWLYPVAQGATTIWERWDGWTAERGFQDPSMNSFNHYAYGAVGDWLFGTVAGLAPRLDRGAIVFAPRPGGSLTWAKAEWDGPRGRAASEWLLEGGRLHWTVEVPPDCAGELAIPPEAGSPRLDGLACESNVVLEPGRYALDAAWRP